jgi:DNA-binding Xre family transcriptional regulator
MIGLEEILIKRSIKVKEFAKELELDSTTIWGWLKDNKIPKKRLKTLSEKLEVDMEYLNKKVNDINTHHPKVKGFNEYKIIGDITVIYVYHKNKEKMECLIDTEDLERVKNFGRHWQACWAENIQSYYVSCMDYSKEYISKSHSKKIYLHRFIMNAENKIVVDHEHHNGLDNRKENLRKIENKNNLSNRKGANKNSSTGVRNVNYSWNREGYCVQFMKDGIKSRWEFSLNEFDEAVAFAEIKRKEIFGEYAGLS